MSIWLIRRNEDGCYWGDGIWWVGLDLAHQYDSIQEVVRHWVQLGDNCKIVSLDAYHLHQLDRSGNSI